jgi:hypothetical protein
MENKPKTSETGSEVNENKTTSASAPEKPSGKVIKWSNENESILVEWCDTAQCYKWLHSKCHSKLSVAHAWFTIPAITLSTISGTASFAQASLPANLQTFAPAVIGSINIAIGILTTIQQYLKISELNEAHRVSAISWDKFARNIRIELSKDPAERTEAGSFLKICRMEYDRLMETSPAITPNAITEFTSTFQGKVGTKERDRFEKLRKPDICNIIVSAEDSRHHWYLEDPDKNKEDVIQQMPSFDEHEIAERIRMRVEAEHHRLMELEKLHREREQEEKKQKERLSLLEKDAVEHANRMQLNMDMLDKYVDKFVEHAGRKPHADEIELNMKEEVDNEALHIFLQNYKLDIV